MSFGIEKLYKLEQSFCVLDNIVNQTTLSFSLSGFQQSTEIQISVVLSTISACRERHIYKAYNLHLMT